MTEKLEARLRERCETERLFALAQDLLQAADTIAAQRDRIAELEGLAHQSEPPSTDLVEALANRLANADLDCPDPEEYWQHQARAVIAALPDTAALVAEVEKLRGMVSFTLTDSGRLIRKSDVEGICSSPDMCFEHGTTARCGPCAIKQADAAGVATNYGLPNLPEVYRLRRQLTATRTAGEKLAGALEESIIWHEERGKALSKQPQTNEVKWRRMEHAEELVRLRAAAIFDQKALTND